MKISVLDTTGELLGSCKFANRPRKLAHSFLHADEPKWGVFPLDRQTSPRHFLDIGGAMRKFGPFHRKESTFQTKADALKQAASGEIWGRAPKNGGMCPTVQAYPGVLPGCRGVEFSTDIKNHEGSCPIEARWYLNLTPGVEERTDAHGAQFASISAEVENHQP